MEILSPEGAGLDRAAAYLRQGEVIAFPTETVYGLAALVSRPAAQELIYRIKGRPDDKPLVLMPPPRADLRRWAVVSERAQALIERWWPGPVTMVLPARSRLPARLVSGTPAGLGVRVPDHPLALELLRRLGEPLATTSANLSGQAPALSATEAARLKQLAAVLDGGQAEGGVPSTVLDLTGPEPRVLREGALPASWLLCG